MPRSRPCKEEATVLVIKECGCRMPVCGKHAAGYRHHFDACVRKYGVPDTWRCAWCRKWVKPDAFRHEDI